jgi:hypothetical protein
VRAVFAAGRGRKRLLLDPPKEAVIFRINSRVLVDLSKFPLPGAADADAAADAAAGGVVEDDATGAGAAPGTRDAAEKASAEDAP